MEFGDDQSGCDDQENIDQLLDDLGIGEEQQVDGFAKKDSTIFVVDCSPSMMKPFQGEEKSQFEKIMQSYQNFMMSKIIANTKDLIGLILANINVKDNSLNFQNICTVLKLQEPSAAAIKQASNIYKDYVEKYGVVSERVPLHHVFWLYSHEVKELDYAKNHLRLFLFTTQDCPHPIGEDRRDQAINHARQLSNKGVQIQLFPIRKSKKCVFEIKKFYQEIISFDPEDLNDNMLDASSKIMDLQSRIRQKQFKKRTLNRLLMNIGDSTEVAVKIFCLYNKAKKSLGKKIDAISNKPLTRVVRKMNQLGQIMHQANIGTYYPLGDQRIKFSKADMNKMKSIEKPGISLVGFKPKSLIKPYMNVRNSYFLYPDQQHVNGSSQFFDALIDQLSDQNKVAIVKLTPRQNQQMRFAALYPQQQKYDEEGHEQISPGFHMIILPYADDIVNYAGTKTIAKPDSLSTQLVQVTKLLINNLTVHNFDLRDFQNPSLQKFYSHLQAHALNEQNVEERPDLLMPDAEGFSRFKDTIEFVKQVVHDEISLKKEQCKSDSEDEGKKKPKRQKKQSKKEVKVEEPEKKSKVKTQKQKQSKPDQMIQVKDEEDETIKLVKEVQAAIFIGEGNTLKVNQLKQYLRSKSLSQKGKKQQLIDRIMVYISQINSI